MTTGRRGVPGRGCGSRAGDAGSDGVPKMPQTRTWEGPGKHLFLFPEEAVAGWALHWPWKGVKSGEILVIAGWGESQETSRATGWGEPVPRLYSPGEGGSERAGEPRVAPGKKAVHRVPPRRIFLHDPGPSVGREQRLLLKSHTFPRLHFYAAFHPRDRSSWLILSPPLGFRWTLSHHLFLSHLITKVSREVAGPESSRPPLLARSPGCPAAGACRQIQRPAKISANVDAAQEPAHQCQLVGTSGRQAGPVLHVPGLPWETRALDGGALPRLTVGLDPPTSSSAALPEESREAAAHSWKLPACFCWKPPCESKAPLCSGSTLTLASTRPEKRNPLKEAVRLDWQQGCDSVRGDGSFCPPPVTLSPSLQGANGHPAVTGPSAMGARGAGLTSKRGGNWSSWTGAQRLEWTVMAGHLLKFCGDSPVEEPLALEEDGKAGRGHSSTGQRLWAARGVPRSRVSDSHERKQQFGEATAGGK